MSVFWGQYFPAVSHMVVASLVIFSQVCGIPLPIHCLAWEGIDSHLASSGWQPGFSDKPRFAH